jgi:hypothetical protein
VIAQAQQFVYNALYLVVFVLAAWSLIDAALRPAVAFVNAGKRTKKFWLIVTGAATAVSFAGLGGSGFLVIIAAVAAGVYLADVRPAVKPYSGGRGGRGRGGPPSRGGW